VRLGRWLETSEQASLARLESTLIDRMKKAVANAQARQKDQAQDQ
jgi:hypothetical protein